FLVVRLVFVLQLPSLGEFLDVTSFSIIQIQAGVVQRYGWTCFILMLLCREALLPRKSHIALSGGAVGSDIFSVAEIIHPYRPLSPALRVIDSQFSCWLHCLIMNGLYTALALTLSLLITVAYPSQETPKRSANTSAAVEHNSNSTSRKLLSNCKLAPSA